MIKKKVREFKSRKHSLKNIFFIALTQNKGTQEGAFSVRAVNASLTGAWFYDIIIRAVISLGGNMKIKGAIFDMDGTIINSLMF